MAHYIDTDKLRAEIERQEKHLYESHLDERGAIVAFEHILSFLDTLEEPEVELDLEKELDRYLHGEFQQTAGGNFNNYIQVARHFYSLGQRSFDNAPRIKGWVARDKNGRLWLHSEKPVRRQIGEEHEWFGMGFFELKSDYFPNLKWKDEPREVELLIREVK